MGSSRYLFVVKDSSSGSLSRSNDQERRLIHRHAQIGSIHRRRSSRAHELNQLPFIEVNPGNKPDTAQSSVSPDADQRAAASSLSLTQSRLPCRCFTPSKRPCPVHNIPRMPTDENHVIDPFATSVVSVDRQAHSLLQYFIHVSHPRTWHSEAQALPDNSYTFQNDALSLVQGSLQTEMHFYTLLASMASQLDCFEHAKQYQDSTGPLIQKAMSAIRRYIETSPEIDQRLIFDIHQMAVTEFYRYELEASLVHLRAVNTLVAQFGGLDKLDPSLKEWIVIGDNYLAAELLQKPLFPASTFDPGEQAQEQRKQLVESGFRFQEAKYQEIIPPQMGEVMLGMLECVNVMTAPSDPNDSSTKSTLHWLVLRVAALRQRLLDLDLEDKRSHAIRITLVIWLFLVTTVTGRQRTSKVLASKLQSLLVSLDQEIWAGYGDAFLWLLLVGAMSSDGPVRDWYVTAIRLRQMGGVGTQVGEVARFSSGFFYLEKVQLPMLEELVKDMLRHEGSSRQTSPEVTVSRYD